MSAEGWLSLVGLLIQPAIFGASFRKAGYSGWLGLLMAVPGVNLITLLCFATKPIGPPDLHPQHPLADQSCSGSSAWGRSLKCMGAFFLGNVGAAGRDAAGRSGRMGSVARSRLP